jgi:hypothetical protein
MMADIVVAGFVAFLGGAFAIYTLHNIIPRFTRIDEALRRLDEDNTRFLLPAIAEEFDRRINKRLTFVWILVEGQGERGPTSCGAAVLLKPDRPVATVQIDPQVAIRNGRVLVFCDMLHVEVISIFAGIDELRACPGECPIASFAAVTPGMRISVQLHARALA